jgi:hypothetical protein
MVTKSDSAAPDGYVVALQNLYLPDSLVLAHVAGAFVPVDNVDRNGWSDFVAKPGSKAADEVAPQA